MSGSTDDLKAELLRMITKATEIGFEFGFKAGLALGRSEKAIADAVSAVNAKESGEVN